ncbi:substrate-binding domain-containing protein [Saliniramus fredricksonii]|uniref:Molybdenum ABC transporter, molybdate-binding protein n=1 Tax=Saliniramus fredricksonii TaxID=1653334 RepID=A0ABY0KCX1_9HYPH|nr:substrate-binding domain-containing protein [Saliniramus fredricksonii]SCC82349.1 molybdenum ABC transporter, molybdate-binding protein [Saliniramus fredricksonii]
MVETLHLLAAGSLKEPLGGIAPVAGYRIAARFGPSGLLRAEIFAGAPWHVFISADKGHPAAIAEAGLGASPQHFCHNQLCLIVPDRFEDADPVALIQRADLRLGISTPGNDPSGDYAMAILRRLDARSPDGDAALRALALTGAPDSPVTPSDRNPYAWLITQHMADLFLTYRSNAIAARADTPSLHMLALPRHLSVLASYALTFRPDVAEAQELAEALLSEEIQTRLAAYGFEPVGNIAEEGTRP